MDLNDADAVLWKENTRRWWYGITKITSPALLVPVAGAGCDHWIGIWYPCVQTKKLHCCHPVPDSLVFLLTLDQLWCSSEPVQLIIPTNRTKFSTGLATRSGSVKSPKPRAVQGEGGASARVKMWPFPGLSCPSSISLSHSRGVWSVQRLDLAHLQVLVSFKLIVYRKRVNEWLSHCPCHKFLMSAFRLLKFFCQRD